MIVKINFGNYNTAPQSAHEEIIKKFNIAQLMFFWGGGLLAKMLDARQNDYNVL